MTKKDYFEDWIQFFCLYGKRLDKDQWLSYRHMMNEGLKPPAPQSLSDLEEDERKALMKNMGQVIKKYREKANIDQKKLATALGKTSSHLSLIESGVKSFTTSQLGQVMKMLDIPPQELFLI